MKINAKATCANCNHTYPLSTDTEILSLSTGIRIWKITPKLEIDCPHCHAIHKLTRLLTRDLIRTLPPKKRKEAYYSILRYQIFFYTYMIIALGISLFILYLFCIAYEKIITFFSIL